MLLDILNFAGYISTLIVVVSLIWAIINWFRGIIPALLRLGNGLAKRKIAIFAKGDNIESLQSLLLDSKLFRKKNVFKITSATDLGKAEKASVYLVHYHDWQADIADILNKKPDGCPIVVYAPRDGEPIPEDEMKAIDGKRNSAVTNFRGRLLNDIVTAMITTSL